MSESELVIYLLVRKDLQMGAGKVAAQCGHAVQELVLRAPPGVMQLYRKTEVYPKIVLRITSHAEMHTLAAQFSSASLNYHIVQDVGRTQVAPGSQTVLGVGPVPRCVVHPYVGHLKLY